MPKRYFYCCINNTETSDLLNLPFPVHILELHFQKFHLIAQNAAVSEHKVFSQVGDIGNRQEGHACLFRGMASLAGITPFACRDYIAPLIAPAPRNGFDMVSGQETVAEFATTIQAGMLVATEQFAIS